MTFDALHLTFIKRFEFFEPVFRPGNLVGSRIGRLRGKMDFRFLANPAQINQRINKNARYEIKKGWILKPIKNLFIPEDNFWHSFKYEPTGIPLTNRERLPLFPFQVIFENEIEIDKKKLERHIQSKINDYKINIQARLFPPGAITVHFYIYLKPDILDLDFINPLLDPKNILIKYKHHKKKDVLKCSNTFIKSLIEKLVKNPQPNEIPGFYTVLNFQGDFCPLDQYLIPLSKILTGKSDPSEKEVEMQRNKIIKNRLKGRYEEDLFIVSNRAAILYVDQGLKKIHSKILKGRRCVRSHFINAIELAYVTDGLLQGYNNYFRNILQVIKTHKIDKSVRSRKNKFFITNLLDPCAYSTLMYSILDVSQNLKIPRTNYVYKQAYREFDLASKIEETSEITETLFKKAEEWNIPALEMMKKIFNNMKFIEVTMGDKFENIQNAKIINKSIVENSFNKIKEGYGEDVANALVQIAEFIERSGNEEAGELFDNFNAEINKLEPKKSVLKSLWGGIEKALPLITTLSEAIIKLKTLFGY